MNRLFTIWIDDEVREDGSRPSHIVLDTREDAVLIDNGDGLRWVPISRCHASLVHRTPEEERWWADVLRQSAAPAGHDHAPPAPRVNGAVF